MCASNHRALSVAEPMVPTILPCPRPTALLCPRIYHSFPMSPICQKFVNLTRFGESS